MNIKFYLEKLSDSKEFQKFVKENKDAYLCSGFIVIDLEGKDNKTHFDYYLPSVKKMFSFQIENNCQKVEVENFGEKIPEKILMNYNFELNDIKKLVEEKIAEEKIKNKIQKMLFSLQSKDGRDFLIGTIFVSGLGMLKVNINLKEMKITDFQKKSFFDMVNIFKKK